MFCLNCGEAISDHMSFCPFCGTKIGEKKDTEKAIVYVEKVHDDDSETSSSGTANASKKVKNARWLRGIAAVMCMIAVGLIVFGYKSITDSSYKFAVDHCEYYEEQMKETRSMANIYGGTGILGGGYASLSSSWEDRLEEAQTKILVSRVKAGVGFGAGSILLLFAAFLFVKGQKKIRYAENDSNHDSNHSISMSVKKTGSTCLNINGKRCAMIAAICLSICNVIGIYGIVSSMFKFKYYTISLSTIIGYVLSISFAVLLFIGKKNIGFLITSFGFIAICVYDVIEIALADLGFATMRLCLSIAAAYSILFILFLFHVIDVLRKKTKVFKYLWFVPAVIYLISFMITCIEFKYFSYFSYEWEYIVRNFCDVAALFFVGLWIRNANGKVDDRKELLVDFVENENDEI